MMDKNTTTNVEVEISGGTQLFVTYDKTTVADTGTKITEVTSKMTVLSTKDMERERKKTLLVIEVKRLVSTSKELQATQVAAKTKLKRAIYKKRLGKNNRKLMDMIYRLDSFNRETK